MWDLVLGDMGATTGILKVIIVRGKRLAIRDFTSSDPYVIVRVENQVSFSIFLLLLLLVGLLCTSLFHISWR